MMTITDPESPATKRQLWALFCATKEDYRDKELTKQEAHNLLYKINKNKVLESHKTGHSPELLLKKYPDKFQDFMLEWFKENSESTIVRIKEEFNIKGIIQNDPLFSKDNKQWVMVGSGCGHVWFDYDKRNKKTKTIVETFGVIQEKYRSWLIDQVFTDEMKKHFESIGNPVEAVMFQNMRINIGIKYRVVDFAEKVFGITTLYVQSRDD